MATDWQELSLSGPPMPAVVDPRRRLRWCLGVLAVVLIAIWVRALQLEVTQGAAFRDEALRPARREKVLPASRGRILARDGTVLACDRTVDAVAVQYRWLEDPPRQAWLERLARKRLPKAQRRRADRLAAEVEALRQERDDLHRRLAAACGVAPDEWRDRASKVQGRVERIAARVRQRQIEKAQSSPPADDSGWTGRLAGALRDIFSPARDAVPEAVTVAEELSDHVLAEDIPVAAAAEIRNHPERFPGVRIVQLTRRAYPQGELAGHVVGYLGHRADRDLPGEDDGRRADRSEYGGVTGIEQQCEESLCGRPGVEVEISERGGRVRQGSSRVEAAPGSDVTLTLDPRLQRAAEELLDGALRRMALQSDGCDPSGGAIVALDVRNGELLVAASAPRFDPAAMSGSQSRRREALLSDPASPLFHRAIQMALPPGSVFKTLTAVALLESGGLDPAAPFACRGYLKQPDRQRCAIFVQRGAGHGDVSLAEALAESCNVYFFHHAERMPPETLVDWARRFGFGQPTGVDLSAEVPGAAPSPETIRRLEGHDWRTSDTLAMSIGQGSLTATPLGVARMMAAVANGGLLVTPHVVRSRGDAAASVPPPRPIPGLSYATLATVRTGLRRAVTDEKGTAHATLDLEQVSIAGKTGTAVTGEGRDDHAWFAGYLPADRPRYAVVVVIEHGGNAAMAACPLAKRLVLKMLETGVVQ